MKVKVEFTIDIDADAWAEEYGIDRSAVREDVKDKLATDAVMQTADLGLLVR